MSVLKAVVISNLKDRRTITLMPDRQHLYWDASTRDKHNEIYTYNQLHLTTVLDLIYRAGVQGHEVKLKYEGGDDLELQH